MSEDSRDSVKTEAVCDARERLRISEIPAGMASAMRKVPTLQIMISGVHQACLVTTLGRGRTQMKGIREHQISSYGSLFFFANRFRLLAVRRMASCSSNPNLQKHLAEC